MDWRIKASIQKALAINEFGDKANHYSVTFKKSYHQDTYLYQAYEAIRKFDCCHLDFNNRKVALEIGTGYSVISAIVLSLLGFEKVITVDITKDISFSTFKKQIKYIDSLEILNKIYSKSSFSKIEIDKKISIIKEQKSLESLFEFLNITYIAPYRFEDIEKYSKCFDYISSQVVLEHVQPNILDQLFNKTKKWLNKGGYCIHTINFIDHFANPGMFQDKSISEFNFLRFSDKYWSFWSGNPIAYTNRLSYIYYIELSKKHNIEIVDFQGENYRKRVELDKNLIHEDVIKKYPSVPDIEDLTKFQRGTLILKG